MITDFTNVTTATVSYADRNTQAVSGTNFTADANGLWFTANGTRSFAPWAAIATVTSIA